MAEALAEGEAAREEAGVPVQRHCAGVKDFKVSQQAQLWKMSMGQTLE